MFFIPDRLKIYTVHTKKSDDGEIKDVKFVREGFNLWAFLFNAIWAGLHRCWLLGILSLAIFTITEYGGMIQWLSYASIAVIQVGGFIIVGMLANDEFRDSLGRRGYEPSGFVSGTSKALAKQRYFDRLGEPLYPWQTASA